MPSDSLLLENLKRQHPEGDIRYCGQSSRGEEHCKCVVIGHTARMVRVRRLTSGAVFENTGAGLFRTMEDLARAQTMVKTTRGYRRHP